MTGHVAFDIDYRPPPTLQDIISQAADPAPRPAAVAASPRERQTTQRVVLAALNARIQSHAYLNAEEEFLLEALHKAEYLIGDRGSLGVSDQRAVDALFNGPWQHLAKSSVRLWRTGNSPAACQLREQYRLLAAAAGRRAKLLSLRAREEEAAKMAAAQMAEMAMRRKLATTQREALKDHLTAQAAADAHAIFNSEKQHEAFELAVASAMRKVKGGHVLTHAELGLLKTKAKLGLAMKHKKPTEAIRERGMRAWVDQGGEAALAERLVAMRLAKQAQPLVGVASPGPGEQRSSPPQRGYPPSGANIEEPRPPLAARPRQASARSRRVGPRSTALERAKRRWVEVLKAEPGQRPMSASDLSAPIQCQRWSEEKRQLVRNAPSGCTEEEAQRIRFQKGRIRIKSESEGVGETLRLAISLSAIRRQ